MSTELIEFIRITKDNQQDWLDQVVEIEQLSDSTPWQRQHFASALTANNNLIGLVIEQRLVGFYLTMQGFEEAHLLNIAVHPEFRQQGLGQAMMEQLIAWAIVHNNQQLWLEVRVSNLPAIAMYKKLNFKSVSIRKNYYDTADGNREDAQVMRLDLNIR